METVRFVWKLKFGNELYLSDLFNFYFSLATQETGQGTVFVVYATDHRGEGVLSGATGLSLSVHFDDSAPPV